ncbi:MAG: 2-oxoacid:ferredoxin oxidoreductase subunit gamma [Clostridia bacterium]|jgi:2-oxoglutarate ferredoxin oxidoreductase subunit gamma|nr:2-oxoacid:ferredoxin oxidoreductase subunit gamma [Clostridia bacterium]MCX4367401.1 2-oxoacid:acceptor oxidoreductase family protein [Clostridia bacterium]
MEEKIVVAGFGGQGVLSLGQFVAYAAMYEGMEVSWLPSYGPEMRGGTSNCSVVVSDRPIGSPIIATPDTLIAMNKPSLDKFVNKVKKGGLIIVNSSLIKDKVERDDVRVLYINANEIALEAGNAKTANIVVLGAFIKMTGILKAEDVKNTIEKIFANKPKVIPMNKVAFDLGYNFVK